MGSLTQYLQLKKLQGADRISQDDYAFTNRNMDILDGQIQKLNDAVFEPTTPIDNPSDPPSLGIDIDGGIIPAGRTVRYKFTYVDYYGNETAASPEATLTTNSPISRPNQPSLLWYNSGGSLIAGNYFYVLSAYINVNTSETTASTAGFISAKTGSSNRIILELPSLPSGADGFNVYRRGPGEVSYQFLDTIDMTGGSPPDTYEDDGSVTPSVSRTPSAINLTFNTNSITVTLPGATPVVPDGYTWKIYRTYSSGDYASSTLQWVTIEEGGEVVTSWVDTGGATSIGSPPNVSYITSSVSNITEAIASIDEINTILGSDPAGSYPDLTTRLDAVYSGSIFYQYLNSNQTFFDETLVDVFVDPFYLDSSYAWEIDAFLIVDAGAGEGCQFGFYGFSDEATPQEVTDFFIGVPGTAPEQNGYLFVDGTGSDSVIHAKGIFNPDAGLSGLFSYVSFSFAKGATAATPRETYLRRGSWVKFSRMG